MECVGTAPLSSRDTHSISDFAGRGFPESNAQPTFEIDAEQRRLRRTS